MLENTSIQFYNKVIIVIDFENKIHFLQSENLLNLDKQQQRARQEGMQKANTRVQGTYK